ncbi:hypothetical protein ACFJIV_10675 [Mucilaginibacter sp. UC70_90]
MKKNSLGFCRIGQDMERLNIRGLYMTEIPSGIRPGYYTPGPYSLKTVDQANELT